MDIRAEDLEALKKQCPLVQHLDKPEVKKDCNQRINRAFNG